MPQRQPMDRSVVPVVAVALALGWLAGAVWAPDALGPLTVLAVAAAFGLRVAGRPTGRAWTVVALVAAWLVLGFGGAFWLRARPFAGLAWVVVVVFLVPLPVVPWLYARGFEDAGAGVRGPGSGSTEDMETTTTRHGGTERR
jgi:hypothetical protein